MRNLTPILLIVISIGLFYIHIAPRYDDVQALMTQENQYKEALIKARELGARREELLTKYNSFSQDNLNRLSRIVPDNVNTVKLVTDLDSVAKRYGIALYGVAVTEQVVDNAQTVGTEAGPQKPYNTTTISFKFTSTYPNLVSFLKDVERSLQVIDVKSVKFEVPEDNENAGIFEYQVSIQTYWLK